MSAIVSTWRLAVDPARLDEFLELIRRDVPRSRAFDGCLRFEVFANADGAVLFVEHWESQAHADRYGAWRRDNGDMKLLGSYLTAVPLPAVYGETGI
jgi:quinol monooxygenase YgiN